MLEDTLEPVQSDQVVSTLVAALREIAEMIEPVLAEEDIIDLGWITQIARVALSRVKPHIAAEEVR